MVFHGLLGTCSSFKIACVCACFENVLLRDNPCIRPQGCDGTVLKIVLKCVNVKSFDLSKYLLASTYSKKRLFVLVSFRQRYPTIEK